MSINFNQHCSQHEMSEGVLQIVGEKSSGQQPVLAITSQRVLLLHEKKGWLSTHEHIVAQRDIKQLALVNVDHESHFFSFSSYSHVSIYFYSGYEFEPYQPHFIDDDPFLISLEDSFENRKYIKFLHDIAEQVRTQRGEMVRNFFMHKTQERYLPPQ
ncbi:hypothetical protein BegalDRAFT_1764 [Beggiatoa alba B18LD]|uniref:Uncharacterized protein n=1 Tax=Beggiatoa alba B18LD TaxID=395493 RepID=I3CG97_9GAMM|nr:hypothetical protein [Beggiatoa alba]EIJ42640.1 hypothetical protein BegalDRAFT_1764 [Beggiatoa alba B18LD]